MQELQEDSTESPSSTSKRGMWGLEISSTIVQTWQEISNWMLFWAFSWGLLALVNLLGLLFAARSYFGVSVLLTSGMILLIVLLSGIVFLFWRSSSSIREGLEYQEMASLEQGFTNMARAYKLAVLGILIGISVYVLGAIWMYFYVLLAD